MTLPPVPLRALDLLSDESRKCIERLTLYERAASDPGDAQQLPKAAAVLVLLFERNGELRVLLTTRSKSLRAHPGQTALPGGQLDGADESLVATAYREAFEEVALPLHCPDIHTIGLLEPVFSTYKFTVTPVIAILTNLSILDNLKPAEREVARIFEHPLRAILDPELASNEALAPKGSDDWPYDSEYHHPSDVQVPSLGIPVYRMHRFRSIASPVKGLTADILIKAAQIAYGKDTTYERYAPDQIWDFVALSRLLFTRQEPSQPNGQYLPVLNGSAVRSTVPIARPGSP